MLCVLVAILIAGAGALDRYVATHPDYLFEATAEEARLGRARFFCSRLSG